MVDSTLDSKDKGVEDQDNKEEKTIFLYDDVKAICVDIRRHKDGKFNNNTVKAKL